MQNTPRQKSGGKNILAQGLIFAASVALAVTITFLLARSRTVWYWTPTTDGRLLKLYALATDNRQFDVIITGSSISDRAFIPELLEEDLAKALPREKPWLVYNASVEGAFLPTYVEVMRNLVGHWQHPRAVMVVLAARDFNANGKRLERQIRFFTRTSGDIWLVMRQGPLPAQKWAALHALGHGLESLLQYPVFLSPDYTGLVRDYQARHGAAYYYPFTADAREKNTAFLPPPQDTIQEMQESRLGVARDKLMSDFEINPMIDAWLGDLFTEAKKKDVALILLMAPESSWFAEHLYHGEREEAAAHLFSMCQERGAVCRDLAEKPFRPADSDYFDGCDHLGPEGAEKLTKAVSREILIPVLVKEPSGP